MKVDFINLKKQNACLSKQLLGAVKEVIASTEFILGEQVRLFEKEFAEYCGANYGIGVSSGTDALFLTLLSLGIGKGDEVICPVFTYIATALSISYTGAKPVFVDIGKQSFNIDAEQIEKKITKKTKAIIVVHLYGQAANMAPILKLAKKYKLKVIEDCAQAHGAAWRSSNGKWQRVGAIGDAGCFSFYPTKNLGACGDAGIVLTNSNIVRKRLLVLRDQGRKGKSRNLHYIKGYNCRLDSIQAAMLRVKLKNLDKYNKLRVQKADYYSRLLKNHPGIIVPFQQDYSKDVYYNYSVLVNSRNRIKNELLKKGVHTSINFSPALHLQRAYKELAHKKNDFPQAEKAAREILCLPLYPELPDASVKYVAENLKIAARN
ncbi:MAG: DegT/DnrJ/EryC1/StrS family aminotransferase [Candidatus Omnitrophota bacterium]